ncbi:MAG: response regulator transcription factor [Burkholderiaceae bacterium]|nr:response regulator transcription factor [Burkholderiaceae bacterium]
MIRILVVDDHAVVRAGLWHFISSVPTMQIAGEAATADAAIRLIRSQAFDVVLLDIAMPDKNGVQALAQIKRERPDLPVLILSMHPEHRYAVQLLRSGAAGYLQKEALAGDLIEAIRTVTQGRKYISPGVADLLTADDRNGDTRSLHEFLSHREYDVFIRISNGQAITKIAEDISLSVKTVSTYRNRVLEKMKLTSNADLVYYAIKQSLID